MPWKDLTIVREKDLGTKHPIKYFLENHSMLHLLLESSIHNRSYCYFKSGYRIFSLKILEWQVWLRETLVICTWGASFGLSGYRIKSGMTARLVFGMTSLDWIKNLSLRGVKRRGNLLSFWSKSRSIQRDCFTAFAMTQDHWRRSFVVPALNDLMIKIWKNLFQWEIQSWYYPELVQLEILLFRYN